MRWGLEASAVEVGEASLAPRDLGGVSGSGERRCVSGRAVGEVPGQGWPVGVGSPSVPAAAIAAWIRLPPSLSGAAAPAPADIAKKERFGKEFADRNHTAPTTMCTLVLRRSLAA